MKLLYVKTERSASLPIFSSFVSCQDEAKGICTRIQRKKVSRIFKYQVDLITDINMAHEEEQIPFLPDLHWFSSGWALVCIVPTFHVRPFSSGVNKVY